MGIYENLYLKREMRDVRIELLECNLLRLSRVEWLEWTVDKENIRRDVRGGCEKSLRTILFYISLYQECCDIVKDDFMNFLVNFMRMVWRMLMLIEISQSSISLVTNV